MKANSIRIVGWLLIFMLSHPGHAVAQSTDKSSIESFMVSMDFSKCGSKNLPALYADNGSVYFPVTDIFDYLKIVRYHAAEKKIISGYILQERNYYEIDYGLNRIFFKGEKHQLSNEDIRNENGEIFIKKEAMEKAFDLKIKFDFRSLSAKVEAEYEFPLARILALEKARENLRRIRNIEIPDTFYRRQYHLFKYGMADWSINTNTQFNNSTEVRSGLGLGAEILGGETNLWLNYSSKTNFDRNQQRYYWRWVDNDFSLFKQVQLGRIYSKSIASLLSPLDGFTITNTPTTLRRGLGDYVISDHTNPEWIVELYINSVLSDYTKADASGFYTFKVPIVYGSNHITLRFYGPNGEERSLEKEINMPYNLLPKGEFEYRISGGTLLDTIHSRYARAEANYGLTRWLTFGGGTEYLSSIYQPYIPFVNFSIQPIPRFILTAEYAYGVRTKATLNYNIWNSTLNLDYTYYNPGQKAIVYNYREERVANLTIPIQINKFALNTRFGFRQNIFENFNYNSGNIAFSGFYDRMNINLDNMASWTNFGNSNWLSSLSLSYRFGNNLLFRPSVQYNYTLQQFVSYKAEFEKQILKNGYISASYEGNPQTNFNSVNLSLRYDFSFMSSFLSSYLNKSNPQLAFSARGGMGFGSGHKYVYTDAHEMVGRSGVSVMAYIDENFNGIQDRNEVLFPKLILRCNGGKVLYENKDSITRVVGLEPFVDYKLTVDESNFDYISWRLTKKNIKITTDPNQFKKIIIPIQPVGEVTGMVYDDLNAHGIGRMLVNFTDSTGKIVAHTISESDGYFSYMGLRPGKYTVSIDTVQLNILNLESNPKTVTLIACIQGDSKDVGNLICRSKLRKTVEGENVGAGKSMTARTIELKVYEQPLDSFIKFAILFEFNKDRVRPMYHESLLRLANLLKEHDCLKLVIQGHTDIIGRDNYNLKLSVRRANSVMKELLKLGVNKDQLSIQGFGKRQPETSNNTAAGRAKNRRVNFKNVSAQGCVNLDSLIKLNIDLNKNIKTKEIAETNENWLNMKAVYSVFFEKDHFNLTKHHLVLLNAVSNLMIENKNINLKLSAHADSDGDSVYNVKLTDSRLKSVITYLEQNGVSDERIKKYSYGKTHPFNANLNEFEKSINRRVLINFLKKDNDVETDLQVQKMLKNKIKSNVKNLYICKIDEKYLIQLGAFKTKKEAEQIAQKLKNLFPDNTFIDEEGQYFKVRVGYMKTSQEALKIRTLIQACNILKN